MFFVVVVFKSAEGVRNNGERDKEKAKTYKRRVVEKKYHLRDHTLRRCTMCHHFGGTDYDGVAKPSGHRGVFNAHGLEFVVGESCECVLVMLRADAVAGVGVPFRCGIGFVGFDVKCLLMLFNQDCGLDRPRGSYQVRTDTETYIQIHAVFLYLKRSYTSACLCVYEHVLRACKVGVLCIYS